MHRLHGGTNTGRKTKRAGVFTQRSWHQGSPSSAVVILPWGCHHRYQYELSRGTIVMLKGVLLFVREVLTYERAQKCFGRAQISDCSQIRTWKPVKSTRPHIYLSRNLNRSYRTPKSHIGNRHCLAFSKSSRCFQFWKRGWVVLTWSTQICRTFPHL